MDANERARSLADSMNSTIEADGNNIQLPGAKRVAKIIAIYFLLQLLAAVITGIIIAIAYAIGGGDPNDPEAMRLYLGENVPRVALLSSHAVTIAVILWLWKKIKNPGDGFTLQFLALNKRPWGSLMKPAATGAGVAICYVIVGSIFFPLAEGSEVGPLTNMTLTTNWNLILWCFTGLLFAPVTEELLFRGVLLGGFLQSWPGKPASILAIAATILLFTSLHYSEFVFYPFAALGILTMASSATYFRLKTNSLASACAVHFSYNLVLVILVLVSRLAV